VPYPGHDIIGEILWDMLKDTRTFTAKDLSVDNLKMQVTARQNVVAAIALFLNDRWNIGSDTRRGFNSKYWDSPMAVSTGVKSSAAINDAFSADASEYTTGCRYTSMLILLKGVLDTTGANAFDAALVANGSSAIYSQAYTANLLYSDNVPAGGPTPTLVNGDPVNWVPGDKGYIVGGGSRGMDAGENIIYMGGGQFWGAPPFQSDLPGMMKHVRDFSNGSASEIGERIYPFVGLQK
jgi:hypothetical protein